MLKENNLEGPIRDNQDLYEHFHFIAQKGQQPLRVDKYLMNYIENATRSKIQQAAKDGNIYVNDVTVKSNYKVKPNDVVRVLFEHPSVLVLPTERSPKSDAFPAVAIVMKSIVFLKAGEL